MARWHGVVRCNLLVLRGDSFLIFLINRGKSPACQTFLDMETLISVLVYRSHRQRQERATAANPSHRSRVQLTAPLSLSREADTDLPRRSAGISTLACSLTRLVSVNPDSAKQP